MYVYHLLTQDQAAGYCANSATKRGYYCLKAFSPADIAAGNVTLPVAEPGMWVYATAAQYDWPSGDSDVFIDLDSGESCSALGAAANDACTELVEVREDSPGRGGPAWLCVCLPCVPTAGSWWELSHLRLALTLLPASIHPNPDPPSNAGGHGRRVRRQLDPVPDVLRLRPGRRPRRRPRHLNNCSSPRTAEQQLRTRPHHQFVKDTLLPVHL